MNKKRGERENVSENFRIEISDAYYEWCDEVENLWRGEDANKELIRELKTRLIDILVKIYKETGEAVFELLKSIVDKNIDSGVEEDSGTFIPPLGREGELEVLEKEVLERVK